MSDWTPHVGQRVRFVKPGATLTGAVGYVCGTRGTGLCRYDVVFPGHRMVGPVGLVEIEPA